MGPPPKSSSHISHSRPFLTILDCFGIETHGDFGIQHFRKAPLFRFGAHLFENLCHTGSAMASSSGTTATTSAVHDPTWAKTSVVDVTRYLCEFHHLETARQL